MSWHSHGSGSSAWRQSLAPLRQEASAKGFVACASLQAALEGLRAPAAEVQDHELVEDLSFLVQQLMGPQASAGTKSGGIVPRETSAQITLCRLLASLAPLRTVRLHAPAANLVLGALRQWADAGQDDATNAAFPSTSNSNGISSSAVHADAPPPQQPAAPGPASLQLESLAALAALLPDHLVLLSEHERAAQLAALHSLLAPPPQRGTDGAQGHAADALELQCQALTLLAACCGRPPAGGAGGGGAAASGGGSGLTAEEAGALLSAAASLLQSCTSRSRPVEDAAHSRMYAALVRALQAAIGEAKHAWVARAAMLVEGLQRFFTYGVQASLAALAAASTAGGGAAATAAPSPAPGESAGGGGGGGGRYRPPHLRRRESQADGGAACSDSDMSDTEHTGASLISSSGAGSSAVDRFRSSRVRLAALSCIQAMAQSDPRAMHAHWTALLPMQSPLQPRPLTPHLLTALLYDPLIKVRALAASTISSLVDGPAQRAILAVAEAKSMSVRAPVRGFLTLSLSLGQLLLGAHAGLLHAVANEGSTLVLPGVLRTLVVLMAATPYERLPQELLPETLKVLRARWAVLSAAPTAAAAAGELGPIHAAYLACLAECFSTKQPIPGLAAYLQQTAPEPHPHPTRPHMNRNRDGGAGDLTVTLGSGGVSGGGATQLVHELLAVGQDPSAPAVLRIEALGALKGLAAHYMFAMPRDVWDDLRATVAVGLSSTPAPRASPGARAREGPLSRTSSSSSLGSAPTYLSPGGRPGERAGGQRPPPRQNPSSSGLASTSAAQSQGTGPSSTSPEDKGAQLSVKLVSDYLAACARQCGMCRTDASDARTGDGDGGVGGAPGPPASPGYVPLAAAVPRQQQLQLAGLLLSPASVTSEEEREAGVQRLAAMWRDGVALLVPAATSHVSYMVRAAGLGCLSEVPEPVFSSLAPQLQQRLLALLTDAAASDPVAAVRAAACKALGAAAAFPAVLAHADLSDQVTRSVLSCLKDAVLSVRIAAGWAVANLCDAHRRRLEAEDVQDEPARADSHAHASTTAPARAGAASPRGAASSPWAAATSPAATARAARCQTPSLESHHYRQLAALCGAAITATQDADKVRANGVRAVGNLLAVLTPDMAAELAVSARGGGSSSGGGGGSSGGAGRGAKSQSGGAQGRGGGGRHQGAGAGAGRVERWGHGGEDAGSNSSGGGGGPGGGGGGVHLDAWLDSALTCLQSTLTTGSMKVQWNACYAAHGLLRNRRLLAHPRVEVRTAQLLLLLVMLVRESGNFKIRTHAAAALAAPSSREAYGDVLPDALLVVAGALEGLSAGGAAAATPAAVGTQAARIGTGGAADTAEGEGDGGEGRFPNYRYTAGLSAQLRSTLLHLLALAQPADARRMRDALARRAEFLHSCLRGQMAEAVQQLRGLAALGGGEGDQGPETGQPGMPEAAWGSWRSSANGASGATAAGRLSGEGRLGSGALELPTDPFGLSGSGREAGSGDTAAAGGLAGLLAGLSLSDDRASPRGNTLSAQAASWLPAGTGGSGTCGGDDGALGSCRPALTVRVGTPGADGGAEELYRARSRVAALAAPLRGFSALLAQLGPGCEAVLRDVQQALAQLPTPTGAASGAA